MPPTLAVKANRCCVSVKFLSTKHNATMVTYRQAAVLAVNFEVALFGVEIFLLTAGLLPTKSTARDDGRVENTEQCVMNISNYIFICTGYA